MHQTPSFDLFLLLKKFFFLAVLCAGYSRVAVRELLIAVVSLGVEHGLLNTWASVVVVHWLSGSVAHGIVLDRGLNLCRTCVPCIGRQILSHWTTREVLASIFLFIYFWLRWVLVAACRLSLAVASGSYFSLRGRGFSWRWFILWGTGSRLHRVR